MLRIQPNNIKSFLLNNKTDVVKEVLTFIPSVIKEETDVSQFVQRILSRTSKQGTFKKTFVHKSNNKEENIRAFAMFLLEHAGNVPLWEPQKEQHVRITPEGQFQRFETDIPQIEVSWSRKKRTKEFQCTIHYVEGDKETVEAWAS